MVIDGLDLNGIGGVGLGLAGLALLLCTILWRRGVRLSSHLISLNQLAALFDATVAADRRAAIWVWQDGKIKASPAALALLGVAGEIPDMATLFSDSSAGLPLDLSSRLARSAETDAPIVLSIPASGKRPAIRVEILRLSLPDGEAQAMPSNLVWISRASDSGVSESVTRHLQDQLAEVTNLIDALDQPVWLRDQHAHLIRVNKAYARAVGSPNPQAVLIEGRELFGTATRQAALRALEDGESIAERHFSVVGGQRRGFSVVQTPIDGRWVVGSGVDITGEEEALAELNRVLDSHAETMNRLRTPVAIFGPNQSLRYFNSAFRRLTELSEDFLESKVQHSELLDAMRERRRLPEQADFSAWKKNQLTRYTSLIEAEEEMWYLPDGSAHRVVSQPHPSGGLLVLFDDVTDRLALERSYDTLIAVQRASLDNIREAVAVFGPDGKLRLANPAFSKLWQLPLKLDDQPHLSELASRLDLDDDGQDNGGEFRAQLPAWVSAGERRVGKWHRGNSVFVEFALVPLPDGAMMLTQLEITDRVRAELALRERSRALEVADQLKSEFVTNMAYGLRTPLNSVIGFTEMLGEELFGALNTRQHEYIGDILTAAHELRDMITNVLDLAVIDSGAAILNLEIVDVATLANQSAGLARGSSPDMHVTVEVAEGNPDLLIEGDRRRLKQMIYNLLSAALDITASAGDLSLVVESGPQDDILISIKDLNIGLTGDSRDRLITTIELGGVREGSRATGLDLALVRSVVNLHQGEVRLLPSGTTQLTIQCRLPRRQPEGDGPAKPVDQGLPTLGSAKVTRALNLTEGG